MCGIVYYHNLRGQNVVHKVIKRYKAQRSRGTNGFGFYLPMKDQMAHDPKEDKLLKFLRKQNASQVLFHHRFPTSTDNVRNACHPFSTKNYFGDTNYVFVHNGYLFNQSYLKTEHEKLGIKYVSLQPDGRFNDSEALMWDIALYLEGKQDKLKARGAVAFIMHKTNRKTGDRELLFARNYMSPLVMNFGINSASIASTGFGEEVDEDTLYSFNYATKKMSKQTCQIEGSYSSKTYQYTGKHSGKYWQEQRELDFGIRGDTYEYEQEMYDDEDDELQIDEKKLERFIQQEHEKRFKKIQAICNSITIGKTKDSVVKKIILQIRHIYLEDALQSANQALEYCIEDIDTAAGVGNLNMELVLDAVGEVLVYETTLVKGKSKTIKVNAIVKDINKKTEATKTTTSVVETASTTPSTTPTLDKAGFVKPSDSLSIVRTVPDMDFIMPSIKKMIEKKKEDKK